MTTELQNDHHGNDHSVPAVLSYHYDITQQTFSTTHGSKILCRL